MSKLYAGLSEIKNGRMDFKDVLVYYTDIPLPVFVYETNIIKKKEGKNMAKISNQVTVDLRNYSPEALRKIKSIKNAVHILLPENPTPEFSEAYAQIKKINVVDETTMPGNACIFNGNANLTQKDLSANDMVICNGNAIIRDIPKEMNIKVKVNGSLIKSPSAFIEILKINGTSYDIDDDAKLILSMAAINIDSVFLRNAGEKTAIINCNKVFIEDEISDDALREKDVKFYNVAQIVARKEIHGYIQANSFNVGLVLTPEEAEKRKKNGKKKKFGWK